ncbi:MAG: tRNA lysidine(34) synthetase TilS [Bacteroidales bacterium]|nr:tRNA lysidine(34) synthetase TilS [Candidatus Latescibacterota bacterium]
MECVDKVLDWVSQNSLLSRGDRIIIAVSGGPDSIALLTILHTLAAELDLTLAVAHYDHLIRKGTEREKKLVESRCASLSIPLITGSGDVPAASKRTGRGIEETARTMRYRFLEETATRWHADSVALGHNRDDQVETILHHVIRGTGMKGLTGMPTKRGIFIRPVLCCSRDELRSMLRSRGILYAIDPSNRDNTILRNRIRNRLLPLLKREFNPSIDDSLLRMRENISEGWKTLSAPIAGLLNGLSEPVDPRGEKSHDIKHSINIGDERDLPTVLSIPLTGLSGLTDYQLYLLVDSVLREHFGVVQDMEKSHFDAAKKLVRNGRSGSRTRFPHGISLYREQENIRFALTSIEKTPPIDKEILIPGEGTYPLLPWFEEAVFERISNPDAGKSGGSSSDHEITITLRPSGFPLRFRKRRPGDRLIPLGMKGRKKLSDIFIDSKIPLHRRDLIPVMEDPDGIVWVPGVVTAERARIGKKGKYALRVSLIKDSSDNRAGLDRKKFKK